MLAGRIARDLMRIGFLVERAWAPYGKWLGRALGETRLGGRIGPLLRAALTAPGWRDREGAGPSPCPARSTRRSIRSMS